MDRGCVFLLQADVVLSKAIAVPQATNVPWVHLSVVR